MTRRQARFSQLDVVVPEEQTQESRVDQSEGRSTPEMIEWPSGKVARFRYSGEHRQDHTTHVHSDPDGVEPGKVMQSSSHSSVTAYVEVQLL